MALDEPKDKDKSFEVDGITWLVAEKDAPFVLEGDGIRVDHREEKWGAWFDVRRVRPAFGGGCC